MSPAQVRPSAAARLAALPLLASVGAKLSGLYVGATRGRPGLRRVCEGLENGASAALPAVIVSIANQAACISLDWLEAAFPVLRTPAEQLVASAKTKMADIREAVSAAAKASADRFRLGAAWLMGDQAGGRPLAARAVAAAAVGLEAALARSEALVDGVLPPSEDDPEKTEAAPRLEATGRRSPLDRLLQLATKLYRRTLDVNLRSAWIQSVLELPRYLRQQLVSAIVWLSQTRRCSANPPRRLGPPDRLRAPEIRYMDSSKTAAPACRARKPVSENVCGAKGCVDR